jgi:hypothetical protein
MSVLRLSTRLLPPLLAIVCAPWCAAWAQEPFHALPEGAVMWASRAETSSSPAQIPEDPLRGLDAAPPKSRDPNSSGAMQSPSGEVWPNGDVVQPWLGEAPHYVDKPAFGHRFWLPLWGRLADDGRHRGFGDPLEGTSWLNRPYSFGVFTGGAFGGTLIENSIDQRGGLLSGVRLGIDMHHYWGVETRWAFSRADLIYVQTGGVSITDDMYLDANLLYYPWGDAHWRPYASLGLGLARFEYTDTQAVQVVETLATMPIGVGLKYYLQNWLTLRFDVHDNLAFGARDFSTFNNFSFTGGVEMRFGGRRTSYYPLDPSIHLK